VEATDKETLERRKVEPDLEELARSLGVSENELSRSTITLRARPRMK
jgi:hypothetical protein